MRKLSLLIVFIVLPFLLSAQGKRIESFELTWPKAEHWVVGDDQDNGQQHITDYIHEHETVDKWTELGNMTSIKGIVGIAIDTAMFIMYSSAKVTAPDAKLTFIQRGEMQDCQWIIFSIEAPRFNEDENPESQLWFVIQGKQGLYTNFVALKKPSLPDDFKARWGAFFQTGHLVYN